MDTQRKPQALSKTSEALEAELLRRAGSPGDSADFDCDVLVVGSGYGGAVAAARLAGTQEADGSACRVWVLERGREHQPGGFPSRWAELPGELRLSLQDGQPPFGGRDEGLYDLRLGSHAMTLLGNGLGGGSLINAGVMLQPEPEVFDQGWPASITLPNLQAAYRCAQEMLRPQVPAAGSPHLNTGKFRLLQQLAERAQPAAQVRPCPVTINVTPAPQASAAGVPLAACTLCGDCLTGCNVGAKGSLDTNYLALADQRGAALWTGVTVSRLAPWGRGWEVEWSHTSPALRGGQVQRHLRARRVVLSAGALGSTEILMRSRGLLALPAAGARLGQRFSLNGDTLVATVGHAEPVGVAADPESDPHTPGRDVGPTISGHLHVAAPHRPAFLLQEFAVPAALRTLFAEITAQRELFLVEQPNPTGSGLGFANTWSGRLGVADPLAVSEHTLSRSALFGAMQHDRIGRSLQLAPDTEGSPDGAVRIEGPDGKPGVDRLYAEAGKWLAQVGAEATPLPWASLLAGKAPAVSVHPLGGCAMADTPADGVVNALGQVFSNEQGQVHAGLVVLDGAIVPTALGVNPALTITALAEQALPLLRRAWGLREGAVPASPAAVVRPLARRHELGPSHASWHLRERLQGPCRLGGQNYWARLTLEFEAVPGWRRALQAQPRVLNIAKGVLSLYAPGDGGDLFDLDEAALPRLVAQAHLSGSLAIEHRQEGREGTLQDPELRLSYRLAVAALGGERLPPLRVGAQLQGSKRLVRSFEPAQPQAQPLRALSEADMQLDGEPLGRWALDLGDLADRAQVLMALRDASNQPDALDDALALLLYGQRWAALPMLSALVASQLPAQDLASHLKLQQAARTPGACVPGGPVPEPHTGSAGAAGWLLSRYPAADAAAGDVPVLLIHGLGVSGSMFTHPSLGLNLAAWLGTPRAGRAPRDVWVLDLSSSIANETWRQLPEADAATMQSVARSDIAPAVLRVLAVTGAAQLDVVAHCMGGLMFVLATLDDDRRAMQGRIRRAVISQTGPLVRLSPMNRLRALLLGHLRAQLGVGELDATPELNPTPAGKLPLSAGLFDALAALFPYPDDDDFSARLRSGSACAGHAEGMLRVRRRADAIFGQLFEAGQLAPEALCKLGALFGWAKLRMLSEGLNLARDEMVTEADGRNEVLSAARLQARFNFPVLFVHGRRNRVFDWQGGLRSLRLLAEVRGHSVSGPENDDTHRATRYRAGDAELVVFRDHGHLDTLMGERAHERVFPVIDAFFSRPSPPPAGAAPAAGPPRHVLEAPWLGPMLGWLRRCDESDSGWFRLNLVLHPTQRRVRTHGLVLLPVRDAVQGLHFLWDEARWLYWDGRTPGRGWPQPGLGAGTRALALHLELNGPRLNAIADGVVVLTLHTAGGQRCDAGTRRRPSDVAVAKGWMRGGDRLWPDTRAQLQAWVQEPARQAALLRSRFSLPAAVQAAADEGRCATAGCPRLRLALASCQYPPGPLDREPAEASLRRLLADCHAPGGPQLLLLAGDQIYLDPHAGVFQPHHQGNDDAGSTARHDLDYENTWGLPALRALGAQLPTLPMLDDHEVRDNWQGLRDPAVSRAQADAALAAFDRFQGLLLPTTPLLGPQAAGGPARSVLCYPGGVPLVMLDTRSRRARRGVSTWGEAHLLPAEELRALIGHLRGLPKQAVKLVLSPVPLLPPEAQAQAGAAGSLRSDTWSGFPASVVEFLAALRDGGVQGVVLLSGDAHMSSVSTLQLDACPGAPVQVVSVVSSGLYTPWPFANQRPAQQVQDGPVAWQAGGRQVSGQIRTLAQSAAQGYALLNLGPSPTGGARLTVRLQPAQGAGIDVDLDLNLKP